MSRPSWLFGGLMVAVALLPATAATNKVKFAEMIPLLESGYTSPKARATLAAGGQKAISERHRFSQTPEGFLESLGAAPGTDFPAPPAADGKPETTARSFLKQHGRLFGVTSPGADFKLRKKNSGPARHSIRLTQTYDGIPVLGGELVVQVNANGGVEHVSGNIDRDQDELDQGRLKTKPKLTANEAETAAHAAFAAQAKGQALSITAPELTIVVPSLLKIPGPKRLAWSMEVWSADRMTLGQRAFIDAHTGEFVFGLPLIHEALNRVISDANSTNSTGTVVRTEGGVASAIADANSAYDFLGDTYNFYFSRFGRDGITNGPAQLLGTVRYCKTNECPMKNAFWNGARMHFGVGYAVDDVCAHELTHGVVGAESGLIYINQSGAINESLADIFGEFVDQVNGRGSDGSGDKWYIGEDLPYNPDTARSSIRSMKSPDLFFHPSSLDDVLYQQPSNTNDNGGVHKNSGVNNKLCYLLTDGDSFRQLTINGMGIDRVAALYYEANVNLLVSSSGWSHLAVVLRQAAINLGWTASERMNLERGLQAVAIGGAQYFVDENASGACLSTGDAICMFAFDGGPYPRLEEALTERSGAKTLLLRGTAHETRITGQARIIPWDGTARIVSRPPE